MKLYGSTTSPYVRRIRVLLSQTPHDFVSLNIYEGEDRETLASKTPVLRVPCLEDDGHLIFDSRVIHNYLTEKYQYAALSWEQENQLTTIDGVNDSLVILFQMKQSGIEADRDAMIVRNQRERIDASLRALNQQVENGHFDSWHYPSICLYTLIDWIEFRQLHNLKEMDALKSFHEKHSDRIELTATDPRK
ncbi:glutathione S-transferase family protein [Salinimonas iocasae]|uniref:Glutathione S-transferase family protein n=1 Tax=Salinimonas iocasae TaxID=2572577 RepID=A0A5B7YBL8_9ALTE|nr:glutathione S-transferase family protein [Salinimonas iocasae]QCZ92683.1 glutathione S-transferase family protein [Salinimonas iocasae]